MKKYNVAVVGATGMVGNKFLEVLAERNLPVENYYLYASAKSAGKVIDFMGKPHTVIELTKENVVDKKSTSRCFPRAQAFQGNSPRFLQVSAQPSSTTAVAGVWTRTFPLSCPRSTPKTSDGTKASSPTRIAARFKLWWH